MLLTNFKSWKTQKKKHYWLSSTYTISRLSNNNNIKRSKLIFQCFNDAVCQNYCILSISFEQIGVNARSYEVPLCTIFSNQVDRSNTFEAFAYSAVCKRITHTFFNINKVSALLLLGCDGLNFRILTNCRI